MKKPKLVALDGKPVSKDSNAEQFYREMEIDVLARTLWGEARGQGNDGLVAVACVVLNRVAVAQEKGGFWWGGNIIQVCQKPYQFSCWNRSDPNFRKLQNVDERDLYFATCLRIARRACVGAVQDITGGATHYHAKSILPYWAERQKPITAIGDHVFYKIVE